jgi:endonuclease YncB( thermonuclease family)
MAGTYSFDSENCRVSETGGKSVRRWAVESGKSVRYAQVRAKEYQDEFGDLVETVNGYIVTAAQWEKISKRKKKRG